MSVLKKVTLRSFSFAMAGLIVLTAASVLLSLRIGPIDIGYKDIFQSIAASIGGSNLFFDTQIRSIVMEIRLPRTLLAMFVGGGLSVAGVIFQVLLRNVLADPYILGISGGASVGALIAIGTGAASILPLGLPISAFLGASAVVFLVFMFGTSLKPGDSNSLLLSGVMVAAFLSAVILVLVSTIGDPIRNALFWLIGYLGNANMEMIWIVAVVIVPVVALLMLKANALNVLALGQETAAHLGVKVKRLFIASYLAGSLITAVLVSFSGSIGFVGLIIPHITRLIVGPDHRVLIPASFFLGSVFLMLADIIARTVVSPSEIPVGAVTAALGAPLFIYLMKRS